MAKSLYVGVGGVARKVSNMYVGVGGVARKVSKAYIGVGGVARQFYPGTETWARYTINITYSRGSLSSGQSVSYIWTTSIVNAGSGVYYPYVTGASSNSSGALTYSVSTMAGLPGGRAVGYYTRRIMEGGTYVTYYYICNPNTSSAYIGWMVPNSYASAYAFYPVQASTSIGSYIDTIEAEPGTYTNSQIINNIMYVQV